MDPATPLSLPQKLRQQARQYPGKAGALVVLVAVMGGLWTKVLWQSGPHPAAAALRSAAAAAGLSVPGVLAVDPPTHSFSRRAATSQAAWAHARLAPVSRNLFALDYNRYPQSGKSTVAPASSVQEKTQDEQAKSAAALADQKRERQILLANLRQQASQLRLQSTVMGATPKALVDGVLVGEGDIVASFRVVRISARGMVIEREGIKLEVQMK